VHGPGCAKNGIVLLQELQTIALTIRTGTPLVTPLYKRSGEKYPPLAWASESDMRTYKSVGTLPVYVGFAQFG
jgi:hypothetical protein